MIEGRIPNIDSEHSNLAETKTAISTEVTTQGLTVLELSVDSDTSGAGLRTPVDPSTPAQKVTDAVVMADAHHDDGCTPPLTAPPFSWHSFFTVDAYDEADPKDDVPLALIIVAQVTYRESLLRRSFGQWATRCEARLRWRHRCECGAAQYYASNLRFVFFRAWQWRFEQRRRRDSARVRAEAFHSAYPVRRVLLAWKALVQRRREQRWAVAAMVQRGEEERQRDCFTRWSRFATAASLTKALKRVAEQTHCDWRWGCWSRWVLLRRQRQLYVEAVQLHTPAGWLTTLTEHQHHQALTAQPRSLLIPPRSVKSEIEKEGEREEAHSAFHEVALRYFWIHWLHVTATRRGRRLHRYEENVRQLQCETECRMRARFWQAWILRTVSSLQSMQTERQLTRRYFNVWGDVGRCGVQCSVRITEREQQQRSRVWYHWKYRALGRVLFKRQVEVALRYRDSVTTQQLVGHALSLWRQRFQRRCESRRVRHLAVQARSQLLQHLAVRRLVEGVLATARDEVVDWSIEGRLEEGRGTPQSAQGGAVPRGVSSSLSSSEPQPHRATLTRPIPLQLHQRDQRAVLLGPNAVLAEVPERAAVPTSSHSPSATRGGKANTVTASQSLGASQESAEQDTRKRESTKQGSSVPALHPSQEDIANASKAAGIGSASSAVEAVRVSEQEAGTTQQPQHITVASPSPPPSQIVYVYVPYSSFSSLSGLPLSAVPVPSAPLPSAPSLAASEASPAVKEFARQAMPPAHAYGFGVHRHADPLAAPSPLTPSVLRHTAMPMSEEDQREEASPETTTSGQTSAPVKVCEHCGREDAFSKVEVVTEVTTPQRASRMPCEALPSSMPRATLVTKEKEREHKSHVQSPGVGRGYDVGVHLSPANERVAVPSTAQYLLQQSAMSSTSPIRPELSVMPLDWDSLSTAQLRAHARQMLQAYRPFKALAADEEAELEAVSQQLRVLYELGEEYPASGLFHHPTPSAVAARARSTLLELGALQQRHAFLLRRRWQRVQMRTQLAQLTKVLEMRMGCAASNGSVSHYSNASKRRF